MRRKVASPDPRQDPAAGIVEYTVDDSAEPGDVLPALVALLIDRRRRREREQQTGEAETREGNR